MVTIGGKQHWTRRWRPGQRTGAEHISPTAALGALAATASAQAAAARPGRSSGRTAGKILVRHGLVGQLAFPRGTIIYYRRVQKAMGGGAQTDSFARLCPAAGAQHCASAAGPALASLPTAVVWWVEHGKAPASILATVTGQATNVVNLSRPLCMYPLTARNTGHGSTDEASFVCAAPSSRRG